MFEKRCMDKSMEMDMNKPYEMDYGMSMYGYGSTMQLEGVTCPVVYECPIERICHREICHHVPQE